MYEELMKAIAKIRDELDSDLKKTAINLGILALSFATSFFLLLNPPKFIIRYPISNLLIFCLLIIYFSFSIFRFVKLKHKYLNMMKFVREYILEKQENEKNGN
jgi:hypothetical protein